VQLGTSRWIEAKVVVGDRRVDSMRDPSPNQLDTILEEVAVRGGEIGLTFHDPSWARREECGDDMTDVVIVSPGGPELRLALSHQDRDELCGFDELGYWLTDPTRDREIQGARLITLPGYYWVEQDLVRRALHHFLLYGSRDPDLNWSRGD
jgi:hypothetical protein